MALKSRFETKCKGCRGQIRVGDPIEKKGAVWVCMNCADPAPPKPKSSAPARPFVPTEEQTKAIDLFLSGSDLAIQAGAGTGKTSTLVALANAAGMTSLGQYVAFNKAIVGDAARKLPSSVKARTAHAVAYATTGWRFKDRLEGSARMRSEDLAKVLGLRRMDLASVSLSPAVLAALVMEGLSHFCQSADFEPTVRHFGYLEGVDALDSDGNRTYANNDRIRRELLPYLEKAWMSVQNPNDTLLPFDHAYYLKLAQLEGVTLNVDYILFDECQDASPVLLDIVRQQGCQLVFVGDPNQAIYEWAGAIDAFGRLDETTHRTSLTQSFRFGDRIAREANAILKRLDGFELVGNPDVTSQVAQLQRPDAILARTNAGAVQELILATDAGRRGHLVGGGDDMLHFLRSVDELKAGKRASHRDLACFASWMEVQDYVSNDRRGHELKCMVSLVDRFSTAGIRRVIMNAPPEERADVVISTAHKAKGREWNNVRLASDFANCLEPDAADADKRLFYVGVTRARFVLDHLEPIATAEARKKVA